MTTPAGKLDSFTARRLKKFIDEFRHSKAQLPTLKDLESGGFGKEMIDRATREHVVESLYVTLTNGTIVKGFKVKAD
jgi:hypothetical protein